MLDDREKRIREDKRKRYFIGEVREPIQVRKGAADANYMILFRVRQLTWSGLRLGPAILLDERGRPLKARSLGVSSPSFIGPSPLQDDEFCNWFDGLTLEQAKTMRFVLQEPETAEVTSV